MNRSRYSGLSLLEMLVVLTLVSMVTTIMFQGYGYLLAAYQRIEARQSTEFEQALVNSWFRETMENLVAYERPDKRFLATSSTITGMTFSPLLARPGIPTAVGWELRSAGTELQLYYRERERELLIRSFSPDVKGEFRYRNNLGEWQNAWGLDEPQEIPSVIQLRLDYQDGSAHREVTAAIQTRLNQNSVRRKDEDEN